MPRLAKKQTLLRLNAGRILMVTLEPGQKSFALDNGEGVTLRAGEDMTAQGKFPFCADPSIVSNEDGLFPGMPQTWRAAN